MVDNNKSNQETEQIEILQVVPVESHSENFNVTEHIQRMPKIFSRGLLYLIVIILVVAVIYSLVSKIDIVVKCNAVAIPASHKTKILSGRNGYIDEIYISEGQLIEKNAPLFLISSKETLTYRSKVSELLNSIPLKEDYYNIKVSSLRDELRQLYNDFSNNLMTKNLKLEQNSISIDSGEDEIAYWQKEICNLSIEYNNTKKLYEEGIVLIKECNNIESELEKARTEVKKLISKKDIILKENLIIKKEKDDAKINYNNKRRILKKDIKQLELEKEATLQSMQNELKKNEKMIAIMDGTPTKIEGEKKGDIVRAERGGTISELYYRNTGDYVTETDLLCTIVPGNSPLFMDIAVKNEDIGFLKTGMEIKYKFDAFSYSDYGMLLGKVSVISPSAIEDKTGGFIYCLKGSLDKDYFEIKTEKYAIKPGMTATAEIVTDKKTIFSILFKKLKE